MNEQTTEVLHGATSAKVGTDIFVTDKAGIRSLPEDKRRDEGVLQRRENKNMLAASAAQTGVKIQAKPSTSTKPPAVPYQDNEGD